jgi:hypothetical protein
MKTYRFISDPGHGWLEVPLEEIRELNIGQHISPYSYQSGDLAYLEEDCDAGVFIHALKHAGRDYQIVDVHQDPTPIRHYADFRG